MSGKLLSLLTIGLLAAVSLAAGLQPKPGGDMTYIKVEARGTLQTGIVAIGAETTGTILKTKDGTLELDLKGDKELQELAEKLDGKAAVVTGTLTVRKGVEIRQRLIITVATLKPADPTSGPDQ